MRLLERTSEDGNATARQRLWRLFKQHLQRVWPTRLTGPAGCTRIPTCRMRFWCSGGGGPPSGEVLLEEAIFKSHSEPPPLEWLSSELLDIPARVVAAGCRMWLRSDEGRLAGVSKSRQLGWARHHCADSQAVWKQTCRADSVAAAC